MLLVVTGSSYAGKTTLALKAADGSPDLAVHDFDEVGVPTGADTTWRQRTLEAWVQRALRYQAHNTDLLLAGQSPLGEVLACPSAPKLDGIAVCLVDVNDELRRRRLAERDSDRWDQATIEAFCGWADWHRGHAADPQARPHVITENGWTEMAWYRWAHWSASDRRWNTHLLDTTDRSVTTSVEELTGWIDAQRHRHSHGDLPLSRNWATKPAL